MSQEAQAEISQGGVPVLMRALSTLNEEQPRALERRAHLLDAPSSRLGCEKTRGYLRALLQRIVRSARLEQWVRLEPSLQLVLQCQPSIPLPVARALRGNVLLVPTTLPWLAASEDAIVAVLAHELAHFSLRHFERYDLARAMSASREADKVKELKRAHEREADITGLRILASAGYDPAAAVDHLQAVAALHQPSRQASDVGASARSRGLHDAVSDRVGLLRSQIEMCGYVFSGRRTPIPAEIQSELAVLRRANPPRRRSSSQ